LQHQLAENLLLVLYLVAETLGREIIRERRAWPESGVERRLAAKYWRPMSPGIHG
jgi:hypothetical protein